jgi:hypothetical protein
MINITGVFETAAGNNFKEWEGGGEKKVLHFLEM